MLLFFNGLVKSCTIFSHLFRYPKIPDFAKCSEEARTEAHDILKNATKDSLLSGDDAIVANTTNNNTGKEMDRMDIAPSSPANVTALVEAAKLAFCEAVEGCEVSSFGSEN